MSGGSTSGYKWNRFHIQEPGCNRNLRGSVIPCYKNCGEGGGGPESGPQTSFFNFFFGTKSFCEIFNQKKKENLVQYLLENNNNNNSKKFPNFLFGGKNNKICQGKKYMIHYS